MARVAPVVPAETDLLCERCGYTLNTLPESSNCPECGTPIADSIADHRRVPPPWEITQNARTFSRTTAAVLFRTTDFFRTIRTRGEVAPARRFARLHWIIASVLFGTTALLHLRWYVGFSFGTRLMPIASAVIWIALMTLTYAALASITKLAGKLTNWEATYRGLRMPMTPVLRAMYYHAAHYLPVGVVALLTVGVYAIGFNRWLFAPDTATKYLYVLCVEVIVGAIYLFHTYWIAMRNLMYANR